MNYGLYLAASSMRVNQHRLDTMSNNLANVETPSFKRDLDTINSRPSVQETIGLPAYLTEPVLDKLGGGLTSGATYTDFTQGGKKITGEQYDLALEGEGFFVYQDNGQKRYTRDGRLMRDSEGYLATAAGHHRLLDSAGQPIHVDGGKMAVDSSGTVRVGDTAAKLEIVTFDDLSKLSKVGGNSYAMAGKAVEKPSQALVQQEAYETSGVEPVSALMEAMTLQRAYDAAARMVQFSDTIMGRAVNDIARSA